MVNKGKNFFSNTSVSHLFLGYSPLVFSFFIKFVIFNDMADRPINDICEKKEREKEFLKKEGGAKA
jgi:hypothetical protein